MRAARPDDAPRRRRLPALLAAAASWPSSAWRPPAPPACFRSVPLPPAPRRWRPRSGLAGPAAALAARPPAVAPPAPIERFQVAVTVRMARNQTLAQALLKLRLPMPQVNRIVGALTGLFPFNRSRPGDQLRVERREGEEAVHRFSLRQGPADEWMVERARRRRASTARSARWS